jgi:two-component system sensor histidine kinase MprB
MSAVTVGAILTLAAIVCFVVMRHELRGQVDDALRNQSSLVRRIRAAPGGQPPEGFPLRLPQPPQRSGGPAPFVQLIARDGRVTRPATEVRLPVDGRDLAVARGVVGESLRDRRADGVHLRVATVSLGSAGAVQLGRSLANTDAVLRRLRIVLAILVLTGVAIASALSRLVARRVLAPIGELTSATGHIESTGDLNRRVRAGGDDEVGRLAARFNAMLDRLQDTQRALRQSTEAQRHLVADASHELRTPVSSLRTNIEVLLADDEMDAAERRSLLSDVVEQTEELSAVISDLIELARGDQPRDHREELDLAAIVEEALTRARRHAATVTFAADVEPCPMIGSPERLGRALNNLLDNAAKFSPPDSTVRVTLRDRELCVADDGPGVDDDELPHIFDRFYRGRESTSLPGSGLGLAIVKQVVEAHGGAVGAERAGAIGGLRIRLWFPPTPAAIDRAVVLRSR